MSQIVERFAAAVQTLVGDGPVKNRLTLAYSEYLEDLEQVDLPIPGNREFNDLHAAMHSVAPVGRNSPVTASIQKMAPSEAWWHARTIVRLYTELLAMEQTAREQSARDQSARLPAEVPLEPLAHNPPRFLVNGRR